MNHNFVTVPIGALSLRSIDELAATVVAECEGGPERTVSLRKLLEAKDAAVRAKLTPGG